MKKYELTNYLNQIATYKAKGCGMGLNCAYVENFRFNGNDYLLVGEMNSENMYRRPLLTYRLFYRSGETTTPVTSEAINKGLVPKDSRDAMEYAFSK